MRTSTIWSSTKKNPSLTPRLNRPTNRARRDEFRDQNARLENAGIHIDTYGDRHLSSSLEMYSDQELYYLGKMITDPEQQARFLDPAWGNSYHSRKTSRDLSQMQIGR